jgi:hypothetical protein
MHVVLNYLPAIPAPPYSAGSAAAQPGRCKFIKRLLVVQLLDAHLLKVSSLCFLKTLLALCTNICTLQ